VNKEWCDGEGPEVSKVGLPKKSEQQVVEKSRFATRNWCRTGGVRESPTSNSLWVGGEEKINGFEKGNKVILSQHGGGPSKNRDEIYIMRTL